MYRILTVNGVRPDSTNFKGATRVSSLIIYYKASDIGTIMNKMPDAAGSAVDLFHHIQHRLAHFHLYYSYVDFIID